MFVSLLSLLLAPLVAITPDPGAQLRAGATPFWAEVIPELSKQLFRDFLAPETEYGPGHRGIDLLLDPEDPISSPIAGEVSFLGKVVNRNVISIRGFDGSIASFEPVCSELELNQEVAQGEVIGYWCKSDKSYHSHCEKTCVNVSARVDGKYRNPLWLMRLIQPSRLMPWDGLVDNLP